jgi:signal transduction histidine kinase
MHRSSVRPGARAEPLPEASAGPALQAGLRTLAYELTVAEARERERIARGLHDDIGQLLAAATLQLGALRATALPPLQGALDDVAQLLGQATRATRSATFELSSPALRLGLLPALDSLGQRLAREGGPPVRVMGALPPGAWDEAVLQVLYRMLRELLINVQRHARASQAWVRVQVVQGAGPRVARLELSVSDDGIGIDPAWAARAPGPDGGFGLASVQAQVLALGGSLQVSSGPGAGTLASLQVPLAALACTPCATPPEAPPAA